MIHFIEEVSSTNDIARNERYREGDIIWAERQTAGRGQRGNSWTSHEGDSLTFSLILEPMFLPIARQFLLSKVIAVALCDTFSELGIECRIKWTNDIYVGDKKLCGILIENSVVGATLRRCVVGVGINVNQKSFDESLPNPISIAQAVGKKIERKAILESFHKNAMKLYAQLQDGKGQEIELRYHNLLYRLEEQHPFRLADGTIFIATIKGVEPSGELVLLTKDGKILRYAFNEINFVLKK